MHLKLLYQKEIKTRERELYQDGMNIYGHLKTKAYTTLNYGTKTVVQKTMTLTLTENWQGHNIIKP